MVNGTVTLRDVYFEIRASEERTQKYILEINERAARIDTRLDDIERRVIVVEQKQTFVAKMQAGIGILLSALAAGVAILSTR